MTALKLTKSSTALVRILALPLMVGALAGCDFASRLPDAPNNLGGYDTTQKPPSVTGPQQAKRLPPPPGEDAFAKLKAPVEDRTKTAAAKPKGLEVPPTALKDAPKAVKAPTAVAAAPKISTPAKPLDKVAFAPLEFEAIEGPSAEVGSTEFVAPPIDVAGQGYTPPSYDTAEAPTYAPYDAGDAPTYQSVVDSGVPTYEQQGQATQTYESVPLDTYAIQGTQGQAEAIQYESAPAPAPSYASVPVESYAIAAAPAPISVDRQIPVRGGSKVSILRTRLPNGAVVNVHPVIGAPGAASSTLARTVVTAIGSPINETQAQNAQAVFDLRGKAERNTEGYVAVEWTLIDKNKTVIGIFPERQNGDNWKQMSDSALRSMGQRVADRIARNGDLRKATLYAAANPSNTYSTALVGNDTASTAPVGNTTFTMRSGATLAQAPLPRVSPRAATTYSAPTQVAARPAPIVRPQPPQQPRPQVSTQAPAPIVTPERVQTPRVAAAPTAPPPTFPTLRRSVDAQPAPAIPIAAPTVVASGPRPLVFRGVRGAPGDGDTALGREVGKLLQQSGARMTNNAQPGALFLTAEVSKTSGSNSDRIEIVWRVRDGEGTSIGQVTQANDVPRGALDNAWGQDAFYAAQGARDGIMELLQSSGALDS